MQNPIQKFGEIVGALPENVRDGIVWYGCFALGREPARNEKPFDEEVPMGQLYDPLTVENLCEELQTLVDERGVMEEFLIEGIFQFVASTHERNADSEVADRQLDNSLSMLQRLERELKKPIDERVRAAPDDTLKKMIQRLKDGMVRGPKYREECLDLAGTVREIWEKSFPAQYWEEWNDYVLRKRKD